MENFKAKISNVWQVSYLSLIGINFVNFESDGKRVVFYYDMTQHELNRLVSQYYASDFAKMSNFVEATRSIIKQNL